MNKDDIKALVVGVIEEYGTSDPFELVELLGLHVLMHSLPDTIHAYRLNNIIVLNNSLCYEDHRCLVAHELGHYFIHGSEFTLGMYIKNNLLIKAKIENEADLFASELLLVHINDYMIEGLTIKQISVLFSVPQKYVEYKLLQGVVL